MIQKIASDMYPLGELRLKFAKRIRTTQFTNPRPNVLVSFHLFSMIVKKLGNSSKHFAPVIEKALSGVSFFTLDGYHKLSEVDYMFIDDENRCVASLNNGEVYNLLTPPEVGEANPIICESPVDGLIVSTIQLKSYFVENWDKFPYLNSMADEIDLMGIRHADVTKSLSLVSLKCIDNTWIQNNIDYCIDELDSLLDHASFILKPKKSKGS